MLDGRYSLQIETPAPDEFRRLRVEAGMSPRSAEGAAIGLPNTFFAVVIRTAGELVGMGRIVGDGGLSFQLVDIAVHPDHQRRGLGYAIVERLVQHVRTVAPEGAHVTLQADGPAEFLYARFGFRQTAPASVGMELPLGD